MGVLDEAFLLEEAPAVEILFAVTCSLCICLHEVQYKGKRGWKHRIQGDIHLGASRRGSHAMCVVCFSLSSAPSYIFSRRALSSWSANPSRVVGVSNGVGM